MKIIESTSERLVARQGVAINYMVAGVLGLAGLGMAATGIRGERGFLIVGGIFLIAGVLTLLFSRRQDLVADRAAGTVELTAAGLLGTKRATYVFADIAGVTAVSQLETYQTGQNAWPAGGFTVGTSGAGTGTSTQRVTETQLVLKNGQTVTVERTSRAAINGGLFSTGQAGNQVGTVLAAVIGVPFGAEGPASLTEAIQAAQQAVMGGGLIQQPAVSVPAAVIPAPVAPVAPVSAPAPVPATAIPPVPAESTDQVPPLQQ